MHPERAIRAFFDARPELHTQQIVLAVSGGPDSVSLAFAAARVAPAHGLRLSLAHLDHALRAGSDRDAQLVAGLGGHLGLHVITQRADVRAYARAHRQSVEAAARAVRYGFLAEAVRQVGAVAVATGHTADDQAETVLMRLLRGAGPLGLAGMRPDRTLRLASTGPPLRVLRPLLGTTHAETLAYCAAHGLSYVEDPSNDDQRFARNRVRHEVLPALARVNPAVRTALLRTGEMAAAVAELVAAEAERAWASLARVENCGIGFPVAGLRALPRAVQGAVLEQAAARVRPDSREALNAGHLAAALDLLTGGGGLRGVHWPGGLRVQRVGVELWVGARPARPGLPPGGYVLSVPGEIELPAGARLVAAVRDAPCPLATLSRHHVDVARAVAGDRLMVRGPQPGDRLRPRGLGGSKKVQDVLTDAKVPRPDRPGVPLVLGPHGPLWVVGFALDERAITPASSALLVASVGARGVAGGADSRAGGADGSAVVCLRYSEHARSPGSWTA